MLVGPLTQNSNRAYRPVDGQTKNCQQLKLLTLWAARFSVQTGTNMGLLQTEKQAQQAGAQYHRVSRCPLGRRSSAGFVDTSGCGSSRRLTLQPLPIWTQSAREAQLDW